jgi:glycosyltransferase involved in cell wall biosynthesis
MITGRDIIIFGDDWGRYPSTIQHIGKVLKNNHRIIWIGSLGLRKPTISIYDMKRVIEKGKKLINHRSHHQDFRTDVFQAHPFVIPFHDNRFVRMLNNGNLRREIIRVINEQKFDNSIVLTSSPLVGEIIGTLGESSSHYLCLDDFTLFDGAFKSLGRLEKELLQKVDSCFSVSEALLHTRKVNSGNNFILPQGVDTNHFSFKSKKVAQKIEKIKKPIAGFFGLLTSWIDLDLIVDAACKYPEINFVIIGKSVVDISIFNRTPNIFYLGEVPFSELPDYARAFDVGLIPFCINDLTIACNPLKLLEYLALGIPVVSTDLPEVRRFSKAIYIAKDSKDFINSIPLAIAENLPNMKDERISIAQRFSWDKITNNMLTTIFSIEQKKNRL